MAEITPMMRQYLEMKERYPDSILFFRLGDFYEMFNEDAKLVSRELDLTLTTRDRNKPPEERTPMCGVPYHSCDSYIARLIAKGYKVAICEQMEDPALAKGLVDRDIIRIITPGTLIDSSMLEEGKNNYIGGVYADSRALGLCLCDISTGEFYVTSFPAGAEAMDHLKNELGRFSPREAVLSDGAWSLEGLPQFLRERLDCRCENGGEARFRYEAALPLVQKQFRTGLDSLPPEDQACVQCAGGLLSYLYETQKTDLSHIAALTCYTAGQFMELDLNARQTLELTETLRGKEKKGSLLWVLDKTRTAMGRRLIRGWMERPLLSPVQINRRQQAVSDLVEVIITREEVVLCLKEITDLERLIGRVVYGTAGGRDLAALSAGLGRLPRLRELLAQGGGQEYLSPAVYGYILRHGLYGAGRDLKRLPDRELRACSYSMIRAKRIAHVKGTEEEAVRLARRWGADEEHARRAAILHDCTKYLELDEQLQLCAKYGIVLDELEQQAVKLLHSKTGACVARHVYGVSDDIYEAIFWHTTGKADMTLLEKLLYIADYMETTRAFPGVERLRALAYEDLDAAVLLGCEMSIQEMAERGLPVHPNTVKARDWLRSKTKGTSD